MKHTLTTLLCCALSVPTMAESKANEKQYSLQFKTNYGFFVGASGEKGLPRTVPTKNLALKLIKPHDCYTLPEYITVTVTYDNGEVKATNYNLTSVGSVIIPAANLKDGNVCISAELGRPDTFEDSDYQIAFRDEFDNTNFSQPDNKLWERAPHNNNSAWNRFISNSNKVVYVEDGDLVTRCIPCSPEDRESNKDHITGNYRDWMSGAVDTHGLFSFKYGRVDVRALTNPFAGSFPAIWLMPDDQSAGWPYCGEIDIWEMINTNNVAYGTVHAAKQSQKSGNTPCNYDGLYHVYTFEWTEDQMSWSIDGKTPYSVYYKSSLSSTDISNGYWPFNKKFYLILNQSVGNGSWASNPVDGHEYETRFDFVHIYQTKKQNTRVGIDDTVISSSDFTPLPAFDLQGRMMQEAPSHGICIIGGKKIIR